MARFQARIACGNPFSIYVLSAFILTFACAPSRAGVIIDEIMQNPSAVSDTSGEWFELFNPDALAVDLYQWRIADLGSNSHVIASHLIIPADGYAVLGRSTGANGGVAVDYAYGSDISLGNGADELLLFDTANAEIDRVEWDGGPYISRSQRRIYGVVGPHTGQQCGCQLELPAHTPFGDGDLGTPGKINFAAATPPGTPVSMQLPDTLWLVLPPVITLLGWRGRLDKSHKSQRSQVGEKTTTRRFMVAAGCQPPNAELETRNAERFVDLRPATCDLRPATCDLRPASWRYPWMPRVTT